MLFIAFILFMLVAVGVVYNIAKRLDRQSHKKIRSRQNIATNVAAKAKMQIDAPRQATIPALIALLENNRCQTLPQEYKEAYISLKNDLTDGAGMLKFDKFFRWEVDNGCYTLVYSPVYEGMKLHYYNFYVVLKKKHLFAGEDISLDVDYLSMGKLSSVKAPAEGILDYLVPSFVAADFKSGFRILKVDANRAAIEEFEREREEEGRRRKAEALQAEKRRIAENLKRKQEKYELEKIVRQELIDNGELFGDQPKRPPIPREVVDAVYRRDGGRCVYCGSTENLQIDHIIPFSKGGATTIENLQLLCQKCNLEKSNKIG